MMNAAQDIFIVLNIAAMCDIAQSASSVSRLLLRITLENMLPWIMIWIAVAGIVRLFIGGGPRDPDGSS
jgi:hypothetical protein